jgi:hypothetical protein
MDSEHVSAEDLKSQAAGLRASTVSFDRKRARYERYRYRFYLALLFFVVAAGLPIVGIPSVRHRLANRVQELKAAVTADPSRPVPLMARVGENEAPLPKEYEIPVLPRQPLYMPGQVYGAGSPTQPYAFEAPVGAQRVGSGEAEPAEESAPADAEPVYSQGAAEKEAYDLVLGSNETVAGMVGGKDPALRFKSWSAARTDPDVFLVRITFTQTPGNGEVPYIWQVRMSSKQVSPLNYYARSIPR